MRKEQLNCKGAFLSNELNKNQLKQIKCPDNFELHYSIYHPLVLMTSRQCLFHQVTGCEKNRLDATCIENCDKISSITNLKEDTFLIEKSKGNYHHVYNEDNFLNTAVIKDLPNKFSSYSIDLSDIKSVKDAKHDKSKLIHLFKSVLDGEAESEQELIRLMGSTTCVQYQKGI